MGFFDKLFGTAKEEIGEMEEGVDVTEEIADEAAAVTCTCTADKMCAGCKAKEAGEAGECTCTPDKKCDVCAAKEEATASTSSDMDEDNLD